VFGTVAQQLRYVENVPISKKKRVSGLNTGVDHLICYVMESPDRVCDG
jgi:hypothetical protein